MSQLKKSCTGQKKHNDEKLRRWGMALHGAQVPEVWKMLVGEEGARITSEIQIVFLSPLSCVALDTLLNLSELSWLISSMRIVTGILIIVSHGRFES